MNLTEPARAKIWSRRLLATALASFLIAFVSTLLIRKVVIAGPAAIGCFLLSLTLGAGGMVLHLFGVAQMRLIECLFVTSFLGNAFGGAFRYTEEYLRHITRNERLALFGVIAVALLICIIGGASNALEVIRKSGEISQRRRLWILCVYIVCPCSVLSLPACGLAFSKYKDALLFPLIAYLMLLAVVNLYILRRDLRNQATVQ